MANRAFASTLPQPMSSGLFSKDVDLQKQLDRVKSEGKKKPKKRGIVHTSLDQTAAFDQTGAPIVAQPAWGTPKAIPDKLSRGRTNRLFL